MAQELSNYFSKEIQMNLKVDAPVGTFQVGEKISNNAVYASATAKGVVKAIKGSGTDTVLIIDSINGTTLFADGATVYGDTSAATAVVDTITGADGSDLQVTTRGLERVKKVGNRVISEVLVAIRNFSTKQAA